jgi:hypothetical protein
LLALQPALVAPEVARVARLLPVAGGDDIVGAKVNTNAGLALRQRFKGLFDRERHEVAAGGITAHSRHLRNTAGDTRPPKVEHTQARQLQELARAIVVYDHTLSS